MSGFGTIINWLSSFWGWIEKGVGWTLQGLFTVLQFVFFTIFDGLFTCIEGLFATLDLSNVIFNYAAAWGGLPPQFIWLLNATGLPQCLAILGAAYLIRLGLNLIPSWATRV